MFRNYGLMPFHLNKSNVSDFLSGLVCISLGSGGFGHCYQWRRHTQRSHHKESNRAWDRGQGEASPFSCQKVVEEKVTSAELFNPAMLPFRMGGSKLEIRSWLSMMKLLLAILLKRYFFFLKQKTNCAVNPSFSMAAVCVCVRVSPCVCLCGWP